ncbi:MAG: Rieske (2Fe-2S) protein [Terracidiphilus sp.]
MATGRLGTIPVVLVHTLDGQLFAFVDRCLHQGASLSGGRFGLTSGQMVAPGEYRAYDGWVLQCPWHGYEYDVRSGCLLADPRQRLRMFEVVRDGEDVIVSVRVAIGLAS